MKFMGIPNEVDIGLLALNARFAGSFAITSPSRAGAIVTHSSDSTTFRVQTHSGPNG